MHVVRRVLPIVLIIVVVAAALVVFTRRPDLEDARKAVDTSWDGAAPALDQRFSLLAAANNSVKGTPGPVGQVAADVDDSPKDWIGARRGSDRDQQIRIANELEGVGRRLVLVVRASPRVSADKDVTAKVDAYAQAAEPAALTRFVTAARAYADEREGAVGGIVAEMFGYDPVPTVATPRSA